MTAIVTLLNTVQDCQQADSKVRLQTVQSLLRNTVIRDELSKRKVRHQLLAERFNVFSALGLDRRENYHSRFLTYLLDAQSDHDQGSFFLERLLQLFRKMEERFPNSSLLNERNSRIVAEQSTEEFGRPDLVIYLANHTVVAIENKIDHFEGNGQLRRYRNWLNILDQNIENKFLIFLTPDGRDPESATDRQDKIVDLSVGYGDLVKWLDSCILELPSTATRLTTVLVQYQQLCKTIAGEPDLKTLKEEVLTLIRQPENLGAALEIAKHLDAVKMAISQTFRENVVKELTRLLDEKGIDDWHASTKEVDTVFGIFYKTDTSGGVRNYRCAIQYLFSNNGGFGWCRPQTVDKKDLLTIPASASLSRQMRDQGYRECTDWWVGRKPWDNSFNKWDEDAILEIHKDNQGEHTLATDLATQVWDCFIHNIVGIEALLT